MCLRGPEGQGLGTELNSVQVEGWLSGALVRTHGFDLVLPSECNRGRG